MAVSGLSEDLELPSPKEVDLQSAKKQVKKAASGLTKVALDKEYLRAVASETAKVRVKEASGKVAASVLFKEADSE